MPPAGALVVAAPGSTEPALGTGLTPRALAVDTLWAFQKSGALERDSVAGQPDRRQGGQVGSPPKQRAVTGPDCTARQTQGASSGPSSPGRCSGTVHSSQGRLSNRPRVTLGEGPGERPHGKRKRNVQKRSENRSLSQRRSQTGIQLVISSSGF